MQDGKWVRVRTCASMASVWALCVLLAGCARCVGNTADLDGGPGGDGGDGGGLPGMDRDGDGLTDDCEKSAPGLDPDDPDSDGDGILDGAEDQNQNCMLDPGETDPRSDDTDGDGVLDGEEGTPECMFDPTNPDTDGDMVPDGMEACGAACTDSNLVMPVLNVSPDTAGNWQIATPATISYAELTFTTGPYVAAVLDEDDAVTGIEMAGFALHLDSIAWATPTSVGTCPANGIPTRRAVATSVSNASRLTPGWILSRS